MAPSSIAIRTLARAANPTIRIRISSCQIQYANVHNPDVKNVNTNTVIRLIK